MTRRKTLQPLVQQVLASKRTAQTRRALSFELRYDEAPPAQDEPLTVVHHQMCRPPASAFDTLRLDENGEWHPDDGRPGLAFSYRFITCVTGGPPMASAVPCRCGAVDCPDTLAMAKTRERWGLANGWAVRALDE